MSTESSGTGLFRSSLKYSTILFVFLLQQLRPHLCLLWSLRLVKYSSRTFLCWRKQLSCCSGELLPLPRQLVYPSILSSLLWFSSSPFCSPLCMMSVLWFPPSGCDCCWAQPFYSSFRLSFRGSPLISLWVYFFWPNTLVGTRCNCFFNHLPFLLDSFFLNKVFECLKPVVLRDS